VYFENFADRWFGSRAQNEQETGAANPISLARTLRTERFGSAHCMTSCVAV
jgi:hypothetical protein